MKHVNNLVLGILALGLLLMVSSCSCNSANSKENEQLILNQQRLEQEKLEQQRIALEQAEAERIERERLEQQRLTYQQNITSVLQSDANVNNIVNRTYEITIDAMRNIDLSGCPSDFSVAYLDHIHAWEKAQKINDARRKLNSDQNVSVTLVAGLISEIVGSDYTPIRNAIEADDELKRLADNADDQIKETFNNVERIALIYGASLPH